MADRSRTGAFARDIDNVNSWRVPTAAQSAGLTLAAVESCVIDTDMSRHFPSVPLREWEPHFVLILGPAIRPDQSAPNGPSVRRPARVWADVDLLLTADSITDAIQLTRQRRSTDSPA